MDDRVKILQSVFSDRHNGNERLWSGDNLTTSYIMTDVDVYPSLRLAYTEKYLNIRNNLIDHRWRGETQEAIYTFQLPEGAVITSLSLWIAGKEEKGILTSKQKATEAYKTIVGVERRDPSVVHWQEGNTVTVRVFPCTPGEERKFKIGITSPLVEQDGEVLYKNVTFRGPSASRARETVRVRFIGAAEDVVLPSRFEKDVNEDYFMEHVYDPDFSISFGALPLRQNQFSFDGYTYAMKPYHPQFQKVWIDQIFLDINSSWSDDEIDAAETFIKDYKVYSVVNNKLVQLTDENWNEESVKSVTATFQSFLSI
jgi:XrtN system VIT domain protein